MNCQRCGSENSDEMNYCGKCGKKLVRNGEDAQKGIDPSRSRICVACGREIDWDTYLCPYCGNRDRYPSERVAASRHTWKPIVGGAAPILVGALVLLSFFGIVYFIYPYHYYYGSNILFAIGLSIIAIAGGVCAVLRRHIVFSMIGCICAIIVSVIFSSIILIPIGLVGTIIVGASHGEFKR
jgi:RNA polymerase subunit RPABC4/transcription elongation factor Spt4